MPPPATFHIQVTLLDSFSLKQMIVTLRCFDYEVKYCFIVYIKEYWAYEENMPKYLHWKFHSKLDVVGFSYATQINNVLKVAGYFMPQASA